MVFGAVASLTVVDQEVLDECSFIVDGGERSLWGPGLAHDRRQEYVSLILSAPRGAMVGWAPSWLDSEIVMPLRHLPRSSSHLFGIQAPRGWLSPVSPVDQASWQSGDRTFLPRLLRRSTNTPDPWLFLSPVSLFIG